MSSPGKTGKTPLFYYYQFVVATCQQEAKFGTITTHTEKYFGYNEGTAIGWSIISLLSLVV